MKHRFGFDAPKQKPIEDSIRWAAENGFRYIDFQADVPPNSIAAFDTDRIRTVRALCEKHDIAIGIHPSSAINNAEYVPILSEAVDAYLFANLELAQRLGCGWLIGHGGVSFRGHCPTPRCRYCAYPKVSRQSRAGRDRHLL